MQACNERVVSSDRLIQFAKAAPSEGTSRREVERVNRSGCPCEAQDRLSNGITNSPGARDRGENSGEPNPGSVLESTDLALEFFERQVAADQPRPVAVAGDLPIDKDIGEHRRH